MSLALTMFQNDKITITIFYFAECNCPSGGYCDVMTGSCDCGIGGEKCKLCPEGHIITAKGCEICDNCVQRLIQRVKFLNRNVTLQLNYFLGISSARILAQVNQTLQK